MLKDRRVLLELELAKFRKVAADLYYQAAVLGSAKAATLYQNAADRVSSLQTDLQSINYLIEVEGRE